MKWDLRLRERLLWLYVRGVSTEFIARTFRCKETEIKEQITAVIKREVPFFPEHGYVMQKEHWSAREVSILRRLRKHKAGLGYCCDVLSRPPADVKKKWKEIKND